MPASDEGGGMGCHPVSLHVDRLRVDGLYGCIACEARGNFPALVKEFELYRAFRCGF